MPVPPGFPVSAIEGLPTPFYELKRLGRHLGGARLWIKRDDMTGLAMGGSKVRALSALLQHASSLDADTVITCGPTTSNHVRLTAAAANQLGMRAMLVLPATPPDAELRGNMLLNRILGARIVHADDDSTAGLEAKMEHVAGALRREGRRPYVIPGGGYSPIGSLGYISLVRELFDQAGREGISIDALVFASGSGCIQSGLHLGSLYHRQSVPILGVTINRSASELHGRIESDVAAAASLLGLDRTLASEDVHVLTEYLGEGYARPTPGAMRAIALAARLEGLLLDPCYTGKAMHAAMDLASRRYRPGQNVVFIHTGGLPGIFGYASPAYLSWAAG